MKDIVFITGNQHKADYLAKWLGEPIKHHKLDLDEIQSLDLREVVEHKARQAFDLLKEPVLVEDVALTFTGLGRLPGPFIKWFLEDLGLERLCKMVDGLHQRDAVAAIAYGFCDGKKVHLFEAEVHGKVAHEPRGAFGFGWNSIFIPHGTTKTYAEMDDDELLPFSHRAKAIAKFKEFLQNEAH